MKNILFIRDDEIDLEENDLLGTKKIAEALEKIILNVETPFSIGLYGGWGTGKSSIINTLKKKFKENSNVKFFVYDAWKYSKDSFRRTFLLNLSSFLRPNEKDTFDGFYSEKNIEEESRIVVKKKVLCFYSCSNNTVAIFLY